MLREQKVSIPMLPWPDDTVSRLVRMLHIQEAEQTGSGKTKPGRGACGEILACKKRKMHNPPCLRIDWYQQNKGVFFMDAFQVYKDMKARTNGEIYIGVVGPVRTGKSTFIKRFMDLTRTAQYDG